MLRILQDAQQRPELFEWFGSIPGREIEDWLLRTQLPIPSDLVELWKITGGGDVFESETFLRPTVPSVPKPNFIVDDIESFNLDLTAKGKPGELYVFQQGCFLSAIQLQNQKFMTLTKNYGVEREFHSLDEWYNQTLRAEFAARYRIGC